MPENAPPAPLSHPPTWAWLLPAGTPCTPDRRIHIAACGRTWDVVRTPERIALPVAIRLHRDHPASLGPILHDAGSNIVYWLVTIGARDDYPAGSRLLTPGTWLTLPNPLTAHPSLAWLHLPELDVLTDPDQLADALADYLALEAS
jgi:hypothetical protein